MSSERVIFIAVSTLAGGMVWVFFPAFQFGQHLKLSLNSNDATALN